MTNPPKCTVGNHYLVKFSGTSSIDECVFLVANQDRSTISGTWATTYNYYRHSGWVDLASSTVVGITPLSLSKFEFLWSTWTNNVPVDNVPVDNIDA